jgi:hypothetical protein
MLAVLLTFEASGEGPSVPPLAVLSCGSCMHMPAIQSFGVCVDISVCVKINGCLF